MDILSWKSKQETGVIFLSVNLTFYLLVLGGSTLISILSSILLALIAVISIHSFMNKSPSYEDNYLYFSRETLEEVFVFAYDIGKVCSNKIHRSIEDKIQVVLGLLIFSWINELFGTVGLFWIITLIAFTLTPQYYSNKENVDQQINQITNKIIDTKKLVNDIIPKYKNNN